MTNHIDRAGTQASFGGLIDQNIFIGKAYPEKKLSREDLQASLDKYEAKIDPEDGPHCYRYDEAPGEVWMHDYGCAAYKDPDRAVCPQQELDYSLCRLGNLEGEWFMLQCFHRPILAKYQKALNLKHENPLILRYELV